MKKQYSAGIVSHSFWFQEWKEYVNLTNDGYTAKDIRQKVIDENIFLASTESRAVRMVGVLKRRTEALAPELLILMEQLDLHNQYILAFISIMKTERIIFDFMRDVFSVKLQTGQLSLASKDYNLFFMNKQTTTPEVAAWQEKTMKRVRGIIRTFLASARLLRETDLGDEIVRPLIDSKLANTLKALGEKEILTALVGGNGFV